MKRLLIVLTFVFMGISTAFAQNALNNKADNIVGNYLAKQNADVFKVKISKLSDGTYHGQIYWMEKDRDAQGKKLLDVKNPDRSLRSKPCDQIVLFSGLKYNANKRHWDGTKIYDPQRGIRAKVTAEFMPDGKLKLRGTVLGIGESAYWEKIN